MTQVLEVILLEVIPNTVRRPRAKVLSVKWWPVSPPRHEFRAVICPEEEGGFSVFAMRYPGIVSQGETVEEAKANIAEAFVAMLEACRKRGISLADSTDTEAEWPRSCQKVWITVDV